MSEKLMERLEIKDAVGRSLHIGSRVQSTGYETPFVRTLRGEVVDVKTGPPVVAVRWEDDSRPFWHSVDINWRCYDLRLLSTQPEQETGGEAR